MRTVAIVTLAPGVLSAVGFLVDFVWGSRGASHSREARMILISAAGIAALVGLSLADAVLGPDRGGWQWALLCGFGALASAMFPAWWWTMRQLPVTTSADVE